MEFRQVSILEDHTSATEVIDEKLGTAPLSHLVFSISGFNVSDEATLPEILAFLNSITVSDGGKTVVKMQSEDLAGVHAYVTGKRPILTNRITTDNAVRTLGLIVPFGRKLFDQDECYPGSPDDELHLYADMTALATSIDNGIVNVAAVRLVGASPTHWMRTRMFTVASPGATGENEFNLPLGSEIAAIQIRQTTIPTTNAHTTGVEDARVVVDEVEYGFVSARHEVRLATNGLHVDGMNGTIATQGAELPAAVSWLDFDPDKSGNYLLDLTGAKTAKLVLDMGVNEATYVTILERVPAGRI